MIDWDSAPANVTTHGFNLDSNAFLLGTLLVTSNDVTGSRVTMASTPELISFFNADANGVATLILRRSGANAGGTANFSFYSKENSPGDLTDDPELFIQTIPEPSATSLLGLTLVGLLLRRRRRV